MNVTLISVATALLVLPSIARAIPLLFSSAGANAAAIQSTVDAFRTDLGSLNSNVAGSFGSGRREINWDGVPDAFSAPNNLPGTFFNVNSPRGVVLSTPGTGFQVSANNGVAPVEFGNIDPSYPAQFAPFSAQRLFTPLGSNITDVTFFIAGSATAGLTTGFGAVFSDVNLANVSSLQFFDPLNNSLGTFFVPNAAGNQSFSFLGVSFGDAIVSRVRITSGNQVLAAGSTAGNPLNDLVVMDDFIYGETRLGVATPDTASTSALFVSSLGLLLIVSRFRPTHRQGT